MEFLHEFNPNENSPRIVERLEPEHSLYAGFDSPVVLLHYIVQVGAATNLHWVFPAEVKLVAHCPFAAVVLNGSAQNRPARWCGAGRGASGRGTDTSSDPRCNRTPCVTLYSVKWPGSSAAFTSTTSLKSLPLYVGSLSRGVRAWSLRFSCSRSGSIDSTASAGVWDRHPFRARYGRVEFSEDLL